MALALAASKSSILSLATCFPPETIESRTLLTNICHEADNIISLLNQPSQDTASIQTTTIGETDLRTNIKSASSSICNERIKQFLQTYLILCHFEVLYVRKIIKQWVIWMLVRKYESTSRCGFNWGTELNKHNNWWWGWKQHARSLSLSDQY